MKQNEKARRLIWIDLEMSGLNPDRDVILEVAVVVTDRQLNVVAEWESWVAHQPDSILGAMDAWNTSTHGKSGLIDRCRAATASVRDVERDVVRKLGKVVSKQASPMCGNSVCQDRRFMARHMPELESYFHYRNLDVSALKIAAQFYNPALYDEMRRMKEAMPAMHQALHDIHASIEEMRFYKERMLVLPNSDSDSAAAPGADSDSNSSQS